MQFAQLCDRVAPGAAGHVDTDAFPGDWINSNPETSGIARLVMSAAEGRLAVRVYAVGPDGLIDWGEVEAAVFTSGPASRVGAGFTCRYDFGFAAVRLMGMLMKGLLVLAQVHTFQDDSGRADFFVREYYALTHGHY